MCLGALPVVLNPCFACVGTSPFIKGDKFKFNHFDVFFTTRDKVESDCFDVPFFNTTKFRPTSSPSPLQKGTDSATRNLGFLLFPHTDSRNAESGVLFFFHHTIKHSTQTDSKQKGRPFSRPLSNLTSSICLLTSRGAFSLPPRRCRLAIDRNTRRSRVRPP
jgi:hypothetical protein